MITFESTTYGDSIMFIYGQTCLKAFCFCFFCSLKQYKFSIKEQKTQKEVVTLIYLVSSLVPAAAVSLNTEFSGPRFRLFQWKLALLATHICDDKNGQHQKLAPELWMQCRQWTR